MNTFTDANKIKDPETRAITDRMLRRVGPT
jgi:hypothetical protein